MKNCDRCGCPLMEFCYFIIDGKTYCFRCTEIIEKENPDVEVFNYKGE